MTAARRPHTAGHIDPAGWCITHRKYYYLNRRQAKTVVRRIHQKGLREYRCSESDDAWHIGNLPAQVKAGDATIAELLGPQSGEVTDTEGGE